MFKIISKCPIHLLDKWIGRSRTRPQGGFFASCGPSFIVSGSPADKHRCKRYGETVPPTSCLEGRKGRGAEVNAQSEAELMTRSTKPNLIATAHLFISISLRGVRLIGRGEARGSVLRAKARQFCNSQWAGSQGSDQSPPHSMGIASLRATSWPSRPM
ncbi:MAG: hypothetical protein [Microviridae sp.]|nr:MAG: hypothetical protein [Microviridae sp.]